MGWLTKLRYSFTNINNPLHLDLDINKKPIEHTIRYGSYGGFSGPWIRGVCGYDIIGECTEWKLIFETVSDPEGGAFDTVVMYDGTAVTFGIVQWTFTSGRLQKLLWELNKNYYFSIEKLLLSYNLKLQLKGNIPTLYDISTNKFIEDKTQLRNIFTKPNGKVPRTGINFSIAAEIAKQFAKFGTYDKCQQVQQDYFYTELQKEAAIKRPCLGKKTIEEILYPRGITRIKELDGAASALRALFWCMWQNNPRTAEKYLNKTAKNFNISDKPKEMMLHFAKQVANSTFGYWGIAKCKELGRTARYTKAVKIINKHMNDILPEKF